MTWISPDWKGTMPPPGPWPSVDEFFGGTKKESDACPACGDDNFWSIANGPKVCWTCHPQPY